MIHLNVCSLRTGLFTALVVGGFVVLFSSVGVPCAWAQAGDAAAVHVVTREEVHAAMLIEKQKGYLLEATSNGGRLEANLILQLVRWAQARDPDERPLLIKYQDYYWAFLDVMELDPHEAPTSVQTTYDYKLNQHVEYRRERILETVEEGPQPRLVVAVKSWWPDTPDAPADYSYVDSSATPHILVINERITSYRLLDMGEMVVFDDITGVKGRPVNGVLGLLFKIIGPGRVVQLRVAVSHDGIQVLHGESRKGPLSKTLTATIYPDGTVEEGTPPDRPDLGAMATTLQQSLKMQYKPFGF